MNPFKELISKSRFQERYDHHFKGLEELGIDYRHVYSQPDDNPFLIVDLDNRQLMARLTQWESGDCEVDIISFRDSSVMVKEAYEFTSLEEYEEKLVWLIQHMRETRISH